MVTRFKFNKFGLAEDPRCAHVLVYAEGRDQILVVREAYHREFPSGMSMLRTVHLNGEDGPDVPAANCEVLGYTAAFPFRWR